MKIAASLCAALLLAACSPGEEAPAADAASAAETPAPAPEAPDEEGGNDTETLLVLDPEQVAEGQGIAERECATCHALPHQTESPNTAAPPLTQLLARYDQDVLANDLIDGIKLGHDQMPRFDFNVIAADALVAYLRSIRPAPEAGHE
jgi:mono/diheme cytochrome c family protein